MNTQNLFYKLVFAQVLLGLMTFCIAAGDPVMLLIAGAATALSWYVVEGPNGTPLPRWLINLGCLSAIAWLFISLDWESPGGGSVITAMGRFTMWVQILMLYTRKKNRDYTLILILSLMQVLSASILSISIVFGVLLGIYALNALGTALLFHLKTTSDLVMDQTAEAAPENIIVSRTDAPVGRNHRLHFRATAVIVALVCALVSMMVFVALPRMESHGRPNRLAGTLGPSLVGFSRSVQLNNSTLSFGSQQPIVHLELSCNDPQVRVDSRTWLLRGAILDQYNPAMRAWQASFFTQRFYNNKTLASNGQRFIDVPPDASLLDATFTILNKSETTVFTIYPTTRITSNDFRRLRINYLDQSMSLLRQTPSNYSYRTLSLIGDEHPPAQPPIPENMRDYALGWEVEEQRIRQLTLDILKDHGFERKPFAETTADDRDIINTICKYFRKNFNYTLDNDQADSRIDPVVDFLFNHRQGHCELFASGLAAMTRSIGMRARVVTGLVATEYNRIGGYFVVRQSNAHAWTEIYLGEKQGWVAFDATPPADLQREHQPQRTWYSTIAEMYDHIQFTWLKSIAGFDQATQMEMFKKIISRFRNAATNPSHWLARTIQWFKTGKGLKNLDRTTLGLGVIIIVTLLIGLWQLVRITLARKQRINALKLENVPGIQRRRMVKSLSFYLLMLDILERYGHERESWMTPKQFADHLVNQHGSQLACVSALTELFYEIRFGHRRIDIERNRIITENLSQLQKNLAQ